MINLDYVSIIIYSNNNNDQSIADTAGRPEEKGDARASPNRGGGALGALGNRGKV